MLKGVLKRFYEASEAFIEVNEGEFSPEEFTEPLPLIVKVVLVGKGRRRLVNLGALSRVYLFCPELRGFVKDFLDLSVSLDDVFRKHCLYTDWEALSLCPEDAVRDEHPDYSYALRRIREMVERRGCFKSRLR